ncbi:Ldh family oxidoreductase [Bordetella genomosp. 4]|uniref:Lactate dehydrogenase n=1 Tax=Bordetella genomosp. 4 TaxID=463044 RepID=A0A261U3Z1_9BORD|nr:Ldh family oxidoreductase [Bordetella genomosp. 4]OZI48312.1 lactate dehydrogenase [Bordetella genomosp. 4]OZI56335.1 lactate dehydrogenase [Bordetella genomosp. 4]
MSRDEIGVYAAGALREFAERVLVQAGMRTDIAATVAEVLVEGDLLGHTTHGLALLAPYAAELQQGRMTNDGEPEVLSDKEAAVLWDGRRLPGPWLVCRAIDELLPRARRFGSATLVIRRSHHIACLASYLLRAVEQDMLIVLASSDPAGRSVAPFGGTQAVFTPNPIAAGIPAASPLLIDISASITTNGMSARLAQQGRQFDEAWLIDAQGNPTRDPSVLFAQPPGTILPVGGISAGHKGYGLALLIEALTGGLGGYGRADGAEGWGATVYLTLHDTTGFGGKEDFHRQMDWLAQQCRENLPRPGVDAVRLPGDRGLALRAQQLSQGVSLDPTIVPALHKLSETWSVPMPSAIQAHTVRGA